MTPPRKTLWPLEPHTRGKHLVLREYLNAWLPILGKWNGRILFVDGFAGPGEYEGGEEGSPLIALRALIDHSAKNAITARVGFAFIEANVSRANHLAKTVEKWKGKLPGNCWTSVIPGKFDQTLDEILDRIEEKGARLAPTFLMIDPFGVSETPMDVVARVLKNPKCEVYVSLMYESINRFCTTPEFERHLDALFGSTEWRECAAISESPARRDCFFRLYEEQLRAAGAEQIVHVDLYAGNRSIYSIFFATGHVTGCDKMKAAIWKLDPGGGYEFRGTHSAQLAMGLRNPDFRPLRQALKDEFGGKGWVAIPQLEDFVKSDRTDYHKGQLRSGALKPLEEEGAIEIDETTRSKKRTFPEQCRIRFV